MVCLKMGIPQVVAINNGEDMTTTEWKWDSSVPGSLAEHIEDT